jgi:hypothetical protein
MFNCFVLLMLSCFSSLSSYLTENTEAAVGMATKCKSLTMVVAQNISFTRVFIIFSLAHTISILKQLNLNCYLYPVISYCCHEQMDISKRIFFVMPLLYIFTLSHALSLMHGTANKGADFRTSLLSLPCINGCCGAWVVGRRAPSKPREPTDRNSLYEAVKGVSLLHLALQRLVFPTKSIKMSVTNY